MRRKAIFLALIAICAFAILAAATSSAFAVPTAASADSAITVISNTHQNAFPTQITFSLEASSTANINKVTLFYKIGKDPMLTYAYPKFEPGKRIKTDYVWNTQKQYVPPGVELYYYWVIEDAAGNKLESKQLSFTVEDTRFKWQKLSSSKINLLWYEGDQSFASTILNAANKAVVDVGNRTGIQLKDQVKIYIYASSRDLLGALEPQAQEWTGGRAFTDVSIIALIGEPTPSGLAWITRAVAHELTHVIVHQYTDNPYGDIPRWLDEGLAMYSEGPLTADFQGPLNAAIKNNSLISVQSLGSDFPADPAQAQLSYAESYSLVDYIQKHYGSVKMKRLLTIFSQGSTYDDALMGAFGVDTDGLENEWRASLGLPPLAIATPEPQPSITKPATSNGGSPSGNQSGGICGGIFQVIGLTAGAFVVGLRFTRG